MVIFWGDLTDVSAKKEALHWMQVQLRTPEDNGLLKLVSCMVTPNTLAGLLHLGLARVASVCSHMQWLATRVEGSMAAISSEEASPDEVQAHQRLENALALRVDLFGATPPVVCF